MTLPKDVRDELDITNGDEIAFLLQNNNIFVVKNEDSLKKSRFTIIRKHD